MVPIPSIRSCSVIGCELRPCSAIQKIAIFFLLNSHAILVTASGFLDARLRYRLRFGFRTELGKLRTTVRRRTLKSRQFAALARVTSSKGYPMKITNLNKTVGKSGVSGVSTVPIVQKSRRRRRIVILGLCPTGMGIALLAHILLVVCSLVMSREHRVYLLAAIGYGMLTLVLGFKILKSLRPKRKSETSDHASWEGEFQ